MDDQQPFSLTESAVALHEMFVSLLEAGFTEDQALYLVSKAMLSQPGAQS